MVKCPHCSNFILQFSMETCLINQPAGNRQWEWVAYTCWNLACQKVISVWMDPTVLRNQTVDNTVDKLIQRLER